MKVLHRVRLNSDGDAPAQMKGIMKPEIKGITCADVQDWEAWQQADPQQIFLGLELSIGPIGEHRSDLFQIVVATPQSIDGRLDRRNSKLLIVQQYDGTEIRKTLDRWVSECEQPDWDATVNCLRRRFDWEYEGMK